MKNRIILTALAITSAGAVALGTGSAAAQTTAESYPPLVEKIAQRFGLPVSDVQAVFDEERLVKHQEMNIKMEAKLDEAVSQGKLTADQKSAILAKHQEMQEQRQQQMMEWRNKEPEERKKLMTEQKEELEQWAEENGITFDQLFFGQRTMKMMRQH